MTLPELLSAAAEWRDADPDPVTRAAMDRMIERRDPLELLDHVGAELEFGTAGLRGPLGPGPNRMNRLVVRRTVTGLAQHLLATVTDAATRGVVVGHDARHGSPEFAEEACEVLTAHGVRVHRFDEPVPTPLVVSSVTWLGAAAGIVVTASHNPAADNGMKVVWEDGAQIVPPVDEGIRAVAAAVPLVPADVAPAPPDELVHHLGGAGGQEPAVAAYLSRVCSLVAPRPAQVIRVATTALHGVGAELLERALRAAGHTDVHAVASQRDPDPDFPTVAAPNPEEPGALDALLALAADTDADVALANDPDADRLALALPEPGAGWRTLTGDETGVLLLDHLLRTTPGGPNRLVATTMVSSRLASRMCAAAGVHFRETQTGFKWLCRPGLAHPEWTQVLLYEEALGYAIGPDARDKDGIAAALVALDLVARLRSTGRTVWDVLDDLARSHGAHVQSNGSIALGGTGADVGVPVTSEGLMERLIGRPPGSLGGVAVDGSAVIVPGLVRLELADRTRLMVRPSGTEPKLKYYCEAVEPVLPGQPVAQARATAQGRLGRIVADLGDLLVG